MARSTKNSLRVAGNEKAEKTTGREKEARTSKKKAKERTVKKVPRVGRKEKNVQTREDTEEIQVTTINEGMCISHIAVIRYKKASIRMCKRSNT